MIALLSAELLRIRSRRLLRGAMAMLGLSLLIVAVTTWLTHLNKTFLIAEIEVFLFVYLAPILAITLMFGASYFGDDWASRSITQVLLFEPRRGKVFAAKMIAIWITGLVVMSTFLTSIILVLSGVTLIVGTFFGFDLGHVALIVIRLSLVGSLVAVLGASIASLTRATGGAFGAVFAYLIISEPFIFGLWPHIGKWMLSPNAIGFLVGRPLADEGIAISQSETWQIVVVLVVWLATIVGGCYKVFSKREIG